MFSVNRFGLTWKCDWFGKVSVFNGSELVHSYYTTGVSDSQLDHEINHTHNWILRNMK